MTDLEPGGQVMTRKMKVRRPTTAEIGLLIKQAAALTNQHQRRRAEALLLYGMGVKPLEIAMDQGVHPNTVYIDLHAFEQLGVEAIQQLQKSGAPSRITASQITQMVQLAEQSPQAVGLPYGRWSLRKLSVYLVKQHILKSIGCERLRQLLKKRFLLSTGATQATQPRSTATGNSGSDPLVFQAFAHRWASCIFRCQTRRSEILWWPALQFDQTLGAGSQPKNTWALLPVHELRRRKWTSTLDVPARQRRQVCCSIFTSPPQMVS
jgi:transposase